MSHAFQLSDQAFQKLEQLAMQQKQPPEVVIEALIDSALSDGPFYETEDWFRHLGASEEMIRQAREQADSDADA